MQTHYDFGIRFRHVGELEGSGSVLIKFVVADSYLNGIIRRVMADTIRQHPSMLFDGIIMYGSRDA